MRRRKPLATAARETASLTASLRKLQGLKTRADAELAYAAKAFAAARRTRRRRGPRTSSKMPPPRQRTWGSSSTPPRRTRNRRSTQPPPQKKRPRRPRQGRPTPPMRRATRSSRSRPVSVYISQRDAKSFTCGRNTHKPAPDGGGEVFDCDHRGPRHNPQSRRADRHACVYGDGAHNDAGLRWSVVTVDNGDDAKDALDRITIPQDVLGRIAPTALPRSSIIISDEAAEPRDQLSHRFIAVLNNQPQGGFVTRRPTPTVDVKRCERQRWDNDGGFGSFFQRKLGSPKLAIRAGAAASTIVRCNEAGGKMQHALRRPHVRSGVKS